MAEFQNNREVFCLGGKPHQPSGQEIKEFVRYNHREQTITYALLQVCSVCHQQVFIGTITEKPRTS